MTLDRVPITGALRSSPVGEWRTLTIPLGVMAQLTPMIALDFWTGFRLFHLDPVNLKFVPINIDLIANLGMVDGVFTFVLPGLTDDYAGTQGFWFGARVHL